MEIETEEVPEEEPALVNSAVEEPEAILEEVEEVDEFRPHTIYRDPPNDADDLTLLEGIDRERADELNRAGIYKFSQLEELDDDDRRRFASNFGWENINWKAWGTTAAAALASTTAVSVFADDEAEEEKTADEEVVTEAKVEEEPAFTFRNRFDTRPEDPDDLTQLEGIDAEKARELNKAGIYKFSQLEELDEDDRNEFGLRFGWTDINWKAWGGAAAVAAAGATLASDEEQTETVESKTFTGSSEEVETIHWDDTGTEGETVDLEEGTALDPRFGLVYTAQPEHVDDLTEINDIDPIVEKQLNDSGIYRFNQIAKWDDGNIQAIEQEIESVGRVGREEWVVQAQEFIGADISDIDEIEPEKTAAIGIQFHPCRFFRGKRRGRREFWGCLPGRSRKRG